MIIEYIYCKKWINSYLEKILVSNMFVNIKMIKINEANVVKYKQNSLELKKWEILYREKLREIYNQNTFCNYMKITL